MSRRLLVGVVTAAGVVLLVASVTANHVGVGDTRNFGWKQITGAIIGGAVIAVGQAVLISARSAQSRLS